uniref:Uncharacterized protein n=1 Tax=Solanum lycopersicum TaxID=4081 RepID=A0A3Q7HU89_SOLLC
MGFSKTQQCTFVFFFWGVECSSFSFNVEVAMAHKRSIIANQYYKIAHKRSIIANQYYKIAH